MLSRIRPRPVLAPMTIVVSIVLIPLSALPVTAQAATVAAPSAASLPALSSDKPANTAQIPTGDFKNAPPAHVASSAATKSGIHFSAASSQLLSSTATSDIFQNTDGTRTAHISQTPINAKDSSGNWKPINNTITKQVDGRLHNGFGSLDESLAATTSDSSIATVNASGDSVGFNLENIAAGQIATTSGSSVTYKSVMPSTDLQYQASSSALNEMIVINAVPTAAPVYKFDLKTSGVTVKDNGDGTLSFVDKSNNTIFTTSAVTAWDSSSTELNITHPVTSVLSTDGSTLTVTPDFSWLTNPSTVYPVHIDPSINFGLGGDDHTLAYDAPVDSSRPTQNFDGSGQYYANSKYQDVAGVTSGTQYKSEMWFNLGFLNSMEVDDAYLKLLTYDNGSSNPMCIYPTGSGWSETGLTYNSMPSHYGNCTVVGDSDKITAGPTDMPVGNYSNIDITTWVRKWTDGTRANNGFTFDMGAATSGTYHFGATENRSTGGDAPYISVDYQVPSSVPTGPTNGGPLMTNTSTLTSTPVSDPNEPIQYWYRVSNTTNPEVGQIINSGWQNSAVWTIPAGSLTDGATYSWYVLTKDGTSGSYNPSAVWTFRVNLRMGTQPSSPTDTEGMVSTNLSNGNATISTSSPTFTTASGSIGISYTYNSQLPSNKGVTARYYPGCNPSTGVPGNLSEPYIVRRESVVSFNYTNGPGPSVPQAGFCAQFDGFVTPPSGSGYKFDLANDDGAQLTVGGTLLTNNWPELHASSPGFVNGTQFSGGTPIPVHIAWNNYDSGSAILQLWAEDSHANIFQVPASWLSVSSQSLSPGWQLSLADGSGAEYSSATVLPDAIVLNGTDGTPYSYARGSVNSANQTANFIPLTGESDYITINPADGSFTDEAGDGNEYVFNSSGALQSVTSTSDDTKPAAPVYSYLSNGQLATIIDPTTPGRQITFKYSTTLSPTCATSPAGFDTSGPDASLCEIDYWDN